MANKWMERLAKLEGAIIERNNIYASIVRTPSPSVNSVFGNSHGLPFGYTAVLYGITKGGKSLLSNAMIGQLHKDDPDAIVVKWNTEHREKAQVTPGMLQRMGIDENRYMAYEDNSPNIFDYIEKDIAKNCQDGAPIKMIIIDSITDIMGRRAQNSESIMDLTPGDHSQTIGEGLKQILPVIRRYNIALVLITQARAEMNAGWGARGPQIRPDAGFATQHYGEYFLTVDQLKNNFGKMDLLERPFESTEIKDMDGNPELEAFKVRVTMKDSSLGPKNRVGIFTFHRQHGFINIHEEVFLMGLNRGIIQMPNNKTYVMGDKKWVGKESILNFLKDDLDAQEFIIKEIKKSDMNSYYAS